MCRPESEPQQAEWQAVEERLSEQHWAERVAATSRTDRNRSHDSIHTTVKEGPTSLEADAENHKQLNPPDEFSRDGVAADARASTQHRSSDAGIPSSPEGSCSKDGIDQKEGGPRGQDNESYGMSLGEYISQMHTTPALGSSFSCLQNDDRASTAPTRASRDTQGVDGQPGIDVEAFLSDKSDVAGIECGRMESDCWR